ncbi:hypothetical protein QYE76_055551 [Lolium multiflorum]|uniref:Uncharacterized protein n=1 Tax=Lolium multiflorum TaxID=4521 RepID=A0AAD8SZX3_LOLMU|nr:hypothetical protein QYE76_055551 [Lolium multiflorum]
MSRSHQLWMYIGKDDKSRVSSADLSDDDLRDEVRRLTCFSMKDNIVLTSARSPYDLKHLPAEASTVAQCYPPTPESGVELEDDDDDSEETEDAQHVLEDSDVQEDEAPEDDVLTRSRRCKRINEDLITTAESSPSGQDDDADETASPPPAAKSSTGFFAIEDDLDLQGIKSFACRTDAAFKDGVVKIPVSKVIPSGNAPVPSAVRDHPIYATVDVVADFADQFTRLESENAHLRKTIKTSADQVLEANKLAADAQNENISLKDELKKLKQKMKDEQDARRAADMPINRARKLQEDSMSDALSLATESNIQVLGLLQKTKGALSRLFSMIFPKMKQDKTLGEMADAFFVDPSEPVEQAGEIDNLTVSLGQSTLVVLCRFHVGAGISGVAPHYIPPPSTFNVLLGSSWFDKPWFLSEGKLAAVRIIPSSWGSPTNV